NILQLLNRAVFRDNRVKKNGALNVSCLRDFRIDRLNLMNQVRLLHIAADSDSLRSRFRWRWWTAARTADNPSQNAAHGATANTARNAARHTTGDVRWRRLFFDDVHFFGNYSRRRQLALLNKRGSLLVNHLHLRGWRWRGRRRS